MKADKAPTNGNSMFVMRVLGHDTALMTQTDDFIFYFRIAFISALLARSLSAMTPLHFPPPPYILSYYL